MPQPAPSDRAARLALVLPPLAVVSFASAFIGAPPSAPLLAVALGAWLAALVAAHAAPFRPDGLALLAGFGVLAPAVAVGLFLRTFAYRARGFELAQNAHLAAALLAWATGVVAALELLLRTRRAAWLVLVIIDAAIAAGIYFYVIALVAGSHD
jgi:hypothetical protein